MERSKSRDSKVFSCSLRILGRRDHSENELRNKLQRYGFTADAINAAVDRCYDYKYLDDRRYALLRGREMMTNGRGVGPRILLELRKRGIKESLAIEILQILSEELPAADLLAQQLERRFSGFNYATAEDKERRRVINYFLRRGFKLDTIFRLLKKELGDR